MINNLGTLSGRYSRFTWLVLCFLVGVCIAIPHSAPAAPVGPIDSVLGASNGDGYSADVALLHPTGLVFDTASNLHVADGLSNAVRWVDRGTAPTDPTSGQPDYSRATTYSLPGLAGVASSVADVGIDPQGRTYVVDPFGHRVWRRSTSGSWEPFAGVGGVNGADGGDGGPATRASLNSPTGIAIDSYGNVFIADTSNQKIKRVDTAGTITTVAGGAATVVDGVPGTQSKLANPRGLCVDGQNNVYIADQLNHRVRKLAAVAGQVSSGSTITTLAGTGLASSAGDNGPAASAGLSRPTDCAVSSTGDVYIADTYNNAVRRVSGGTITLAAGTYVPGSSGDGGSATAARLSKPEGVAVDGGGSLWIADTGNDRVRVVRGGVIKGAVGFLNGDGFPSEVAKVQPLGITFDPSGNLFVTDAYTYEVRWVNKNTATANFPGSSQPDLRTAIVDGLSLPTGAYGAADLVFDSQGRLYLADQFGNRVWRRSTSGSWEPIAGTGDTTGGFTGDGQAATQAKLNAPVSVAFAPSGTIYICDSGNQRIRKVDPSTGLISTVAGGGQVLGDNGPADQAKLATPRGICVDAAGNLFIADYLHQIIRKVTATNGVVTGSSTITTFAGVYGVAGPGGDGGPATSAWLRKPADVACASNGDIFIADTGDHRIRWVDHASNYIYTIAGSYLGFSGDGGASDLARLNYPSGLAISPLGDLWISDTSNLRVRWINLAGFNLTATPTPTATWTPSPVPPTATRTATATPTRTPSPTRTATQAPPASTNTPTRTWTPTSTPTLAPTRTSTPAPSAFSAAGQIRYYSNGLPVPGVSVQAVGPSFNSALLSDANGQFTVGGIPAGSSLSIVPRKDGDRTAAVSALDAVYIQQVLTRYRSFNAVQQIACDVTGDGTLSALDAALILQYKVDLITTLPVTRACGQDWAFYPSPSSADATVTVPYSTSAGCTAGALGYASLNSPLSGQDFTALAFGDCTGNWGSGGALVSRALRTGSGSDADVSAGRLRRRGRFIEMEIQVDRPGLFNALDLDVSYDRQQLTFAGVKKSGAAAGAMAATNGKTAGRVRVALASGSEIQERSPLVFRFRALRPHVSSAAARIVRATVQ